MSSMRCYTKWGTSSVEHYIIYEWGVQHMHRRNGPSRVLYFYWSLTGQHRVFWFAATYEFMRGFASMLEFKPMKRMEAATDAIPCPLQLARLMTGLSLREAHGYPRSYIRYHLQLFARLNGSEFRAFGISVRAVQRHIDWHHHSKHHGIPFHMCFITQLFRKDMRLKLLLSDFKTKWWRALVGPCRNL